MVYKRNFIVVLKTYDGKVLRERKDNTILIPFGTEYCIGMKNLESRNVVVDISIDGEDVLKGNQLVIKPNTSIDLQRFLDNDRSGARFKFIERIAAISEHRGEKTEDGILRVEYRFEKEKPEVRPMIWDYKYTTGGWEYRGTSNGNGSNTYGVCNTADANVSTNLDGIGSLGILGSEKCNCSNIKTLSLEEAKVKYPERYEEPKNDVGITGRGSMSNQAFDYTTVGDLETNSHVICFYLKGYAPEGNEPITAPITVKEKITCELCGKKEKSSATFCSRCGAGLLK